ncbi:MAG: polyhydroxyalkanoate synthesis regulator [Planctomycetes bacterium]|nr:polyhydroxyalkanoate synthesis regulator [Planctomycetota bacterium]
MQELLKKALSLGLGAMLVSKDKVEDVVNELVKKGELGKEEGKTLVSELIEKGEAGVNELEVMIEKVVKSVTEKLSLPTRKEFNELKSEIEELKERVNKQT